MEDKRNTKKLVYPDPWAGFVYRGRRDTRPLDITDPMGILGEPLLTASELHNKYPDSYDKHGRLIHDYCYNKEGKMLKRTIVSSGEQSDVVMSQVDTKSKPLIATGVDMPIEVVRQEMEKIAISVVEKKIMHEDGVAYQLYQEERKCLCNIGCDGSPSVCVWSKLTRKQKEKKRKLERVRKAKEKRNAEKIMLASTKQLFWVMCSSCIESGCDFRCDCAECKRINK
jgi:hypothetical protein